MKETILQLPAQITKITTMAHKSLRLTVDSQENLTDEQAQKVMAAHEKVGWFCFASEAPLRPENLVDLPPLVWEKDQKSPSQRLRAVMFLYWQQHKPSEDFDTWYVSQLNKLIEAWKEKLT